MNSEAESYLFEHLTRERALHVPDVRSLSRTDVENMLDDAFREVGASGKVYGKKEALKTLLERYGQPYPDTWRIADVACQTLGKTCYLLTYFLHQEEGKSHRATLWHKKDGMWKALYHQGTKAL